MNTMQREHEWARVIEDNAGGRWVITEDEGWGDLQALSEEEQGATLVTACVDPDALIRHADGLTHFSDAIDCPCRCEHAPYADLVATAEYPETRLIATWPQ
jgi:hypothetical protein